MAGLFSPDVLEKGKVSGWRFQKKYRLEKYDEDSGFDKDYFWKSTWKAIAQNAENIARERGINLEAFRGALEKKFKKEFDPDSSDTPLTTALNALAEHHEKIASELAKETAAASVSRPKVVASAEPLVQESAPAARKQPAAPPAERPATPSEPTAEELETLEPTKAGQKCQVWTGSYGGNKHALLKQLTKKGDEKTVHYHVLDVNEGSEVAEIDAYRNAYVNNSVIVAPQSAKPIASIPGRDAPKEGPYPLILLKDMKANPAAYLYNNHDQALDKAYELCPEG